jgi:hypothetical protein
MVQAGQVSSLVRTGSYPLRRAMSFKSSNAATRSELLVPYCWDRIPACRRWHLLRLSGEVAVEGGCPRAQWMPLNFIVAHDANTGNGHRSDQNHSARATSFIL